MVRGKEAKISALVYVGVAVILCFVHVPAGSVGLYPGAPFPHRLLYPFFHANWYHCLINCWCLLSIVFLYRIDLPELVASLVIAMAYPVNALAFLYPDPCLPTVGMSGVCYALLGAFAPYKLNPLGYHLWWAFFIGIGFLFPQSNAWLHLYCYVAGIIYSYIRMALTR